MIVQLGTRIEGAASDRGALRRGGGALGGVVAVPVAFAFTLAAHACRRVELKGAR